MCSVGDPCLLALSPSATTLFQLNFGPSRPRYLLLPLTLFFSLCSVGFAGTAPSESGSHDPHLHRAHFPDNRRSAGRRMKSVIRPRVNLPCNDVFCDLSSKFVAAFYLVQCNVSGRGRAGSFACSLGGELLPSRRGEGAQGTWRRAP